MLPDEDEDEGEEVKEEEEEDEVAFPDGRERTCIDDEEGEEEEKDAELYGGDDVAEGPPDLAVARLPLDRFLFPPPTRDGEGDGTGWTDADTLTSPPDWPVENPVAPCLFLFWYRSRSLRRLRSLSSSISFKLSAYIPTSLKPPTSA